MRTRSSKWAGLCVPLMFSLAACMGDVSESSEQELDEQSEALLLPPVFPQIQAFSDPGVAPYAKRAQQLVLHSAAEYEAAFGHAPPVKLDGGDVIVFYSAGIEPTGGYEVSFTRLISLPRPIPSPRPGMHPDPLPAPFDAVVGTEVKAPGKNCVVSPLPSAPYALGVIRDVPFARLGFQRYDLTVDCTPCEHLKCKDGTHCEIGPVITESARGVAECVPNPQTCETACPDQACHYEHVLCFAAPCYPIPRCEGEPDAGLADPENPPPPPHCGFALDDCQHAGCPVLDCHPLPEDPCFDNDCEERGLHCIAEADRPHCVP
jgi:hypothetical protein